MVTLEYQLELRSMFLAPVGQLLAPAKVLVRSEDCSIYESFPPTREGYQAANRFMRLLERGYSPDRANSILYLNCGKGAFEYYYEPTAHDKLSDEIAPYIPVGYMVELFSVDEFAAVETDGLFQAFQLDGPRGVFSFCETYSCDYSEALAYCAGRAQYEDEDKGSWLVSHHTSNYSY